MRAYFHETSVHMPFRIPVRTTQETCFVHVWARMNMTCLAVVFAAILLRSQGDLPWRNAARVDVLVLLACVLMVSPVHRTSDEIVTMKEAERRQEAKRLMVHGAPLL